MSSNDENRRFKGWDKSLVCIYAGAALAVSALAWANNQGFLDDVKESCSFPSFGLDGDLGSDSLLAPSTLDND